MSACQVSVESQKDFALGVSDEYSSRPCSIKFRSTIKRKRNHRNNFDSIASDTVIFDVFPKTSRGDLRGVVDSLRQFDIGVAFSITRRVFYCRIKFRHISQPFCAV
jgi:hypothetical protein